MAGSSGKQKKLSRSLTTGSETVVDYICQPCCGDNKTIEAVGFCNDCSEFLCDECFRYHLKPPLTRNHRLLDIDQVKNDQSLSAFKDICTERCGRHRGEIIKYYCLDHACLGCGVCITTDHRSCPRVKYIPDIAEDAANSKEQCELIKKLNDVILKSKAIIVTSKSNKNVAKEMYTRALEDVKQVRKDVIEALDKLEKDIETEAKTAMEEDTQNMSSNVDECEKILSKTETLKSNLKTLKNDRKYCGLFIAMKKDQDMIISQDKELQQIAENNTIRDYLFHPTKLLQEFVKHKQGLLWFVKTKVTNVAEIGLRSETDIDKINITGMAMLEKNRLVVIDNKINKVKLIDVKQSRIVFELKVPSSPWDITTTDLADEIAVTIGSTCKIFLLNVKDGVLHKDKEINTACPCYGIACIGDRFVVSFTRPEKLVIIDKQGTVLQTIEKDVSGKKLFSNIYSITVNKTRGNIYVPDYDKHTVTCLSLSGDVKGVYQDNDLKRPTAVTVNYQTGIVYVSGCVSRNIHQTTPDCKKMRILLSKKDGVTLPISLCYCEETDRLYVGQYDNVLKVYALSAN